MEITFKVRNFVLFISMSFCFLLCGFSAKASEEIMFDGNYQYDYANEVLEILNEERVSAGLSPLVSNEEIQKNAMQRAAEIAVYYSHTRPDDTTCNTAITVDYLTYGENIAYGQTTAEAVMTAWMNSTGHRANILNKDFKSAGIGCFIQGDVITWVQLFTDNTTSSVLPSGSQEAYCSVNVLPKNVSLGGQLKGTNICSRQTIQVPENETVNVEVVNFNTQVSYPKALVIDSGYYIKGEAFQPDSDYFTYEFGYYGGIDITGYKSTEDNPYATTMDVGIGSHIWCLNVEVYHQHQPGAEATCTADQVCLTCGDVLAKAKGHSIYGNGCTKDKACTRCGEVFVKAAGHVAKTPATCTEDAKCMYCYTVMEKALGHTYPPRDCLKELHCSRCGYMRYKAYEQHYFSEERFYQSATIFSPALYIKECICCDQYELVEVGEKLKPYINLNAETISLKRNQSFSGLLVTMAKDDVIKSVKSGNSKVLKVKNYTADGKIVIKAQKKAGNTKLTITTKAGAKKVLKVRVQKSTIKTTAIRNVYTYMTINKGETYTFTPTLEPITSKQKITYKSSRKKIASISLKGGVLKAKKSGTTVITIKSGSVSVKCTVVVR